MSLGRSFAAAVALVLGLGSPGAEAQPQRLTVELNKLETAESGACQAYFLFRNGTGQTLEAFELSLAILDEQGVIDRLLSIDAAPVPAQRTTLRLFEIPGIGCDRISEVILHDVPACAAPGDEPVDCFAMMDLVSRADARLIK